MNAVLPLDATKEEIYAVSSGKDIKLRFISGNNVIDRYFEVQDQVKKLKQVITCYTVRKIVYKDGLTKGISNETMTENKYLYTTDTDENHIYEALRILRKNGYILLYPKKN